MSPEDGEELSGGDTTVFDDTPNAFTFSARNLAGDRKDPFFVGNSFFNENWVTAPASTEGRDGLGPLYNARSCSGCHLKDGRGRPPVEEGERFASMLVRLSIPGQGPHGDPLPDPVYGGQIQPAGIEGVPGEAEPHVAWTEEPGTYPDGTPYSLRRPTFSLDDPQYGPFSESLLTSARVAPAMIGLGLLEAIPSEDLLTNEDPSDADGDGVSGRANRVWSATMGGPVVGRFGWKANQPDMTHQTAGAFLGDLGMTTEMNPSQNCTEAQAACAAAPTGGDPEVSPHILEAVVFYGSVLAVPARRGVDDAAVLRGREAFEAVGCAGCHVRRWETGTLEGYPELSDQVIWPYTDLLLHDMGPELADGRPDFEADGQEWRTPPLWGIGLVPTVNGHDLLLHDGRARGVEEAILWHGGEASASRQAFMELSAEERRELLAFVESL